MQEQLFPQRIRFLKGIFPAPGCRQAAPHFHFTQCKLASSVVLLYHGLGGIGSAVGAEIKLSHIGVGGASLFLHFLEEFPGAFHFHLHAALQVLLAQCIFHVIPGRAATSVPVAEGQEECIQILDLRPVFPHLVDFFRVRAVGVAGGQEGIHAGAVHAFPCKIVIRELIPFIIGPEYLLGNQIFYAAAAQDLRKGRRVAKGIRQPENLAVHTQFFLIITFSMNQLSDQRLAAGHVGIRLHPHGAVRNPLSCADRFLNPFKQLRIIFSAHFIGGRLALDEFIFRIFLQKTELCRKGTLGFPVGFRHGPQPCQIQMGVSHRVKNRHGRTVNSFHRRFQRFSGRPVAFRSFFLVLFKIHNQGELLQRLCDFCRTQGGLIQSFQQLAQCIHVHVQLVGILIPDAVGAYSQRPSGPFRQWIRKGTGKHGTGCAASVRAFGIIMPRIGLHEHLIALSGFSRPCQCIVFHVMMGFGYPVSPVGAEGTSIDEQGGFPARLQIHYNPFPLRPARKLYPASEPAVFISIPPCESRLYLFKRKPQRLLRTDVLHRPVSFPPELSQRFVKIVLQRPYPMPDPAAPFRMHDFHF